MLRKIKVNNFAIIESLDLNLDLGFVVITGETGAGKSLLIHALELALGGRASAEMIRFGHDKAIVEACFSPSLKDRKRLGELLDEHGCPELDDLHVKRIISANGRNRVFINGSLSSIKALQEVTSGFVEVVGQHASHMLLEPENHLEILDGFASLTDQVNVFKSKAIRFRKMKSELNELLESETHRMTRLQQINDSLDEINMAGLRPGEESELSLRIEKIHNAEELREKSRSAVLQLQDMDGSSLDQLGAAIESLSAIVSYDPSLEQIYNTLDAANIEIRESVRDLRPFAEDSMNEAAELENIQERLFLIKDLKNRYGGSLEAVEDSISSLQDEANLLNQRSRKMAELELEISSVQDEIMQAARHLSVKRKSAAEKMSSLIQKELSQLGMPNCSFRVHFSTEHPEKLKDDGLDQVLFMISPNPGEGMKPLNAIASGGELSRILLALKSSLIDADPVNTYVFDEVDTGIGGAIAESVGQKLQLVGERRQALCITHLPQVASCAHHHLYVDKYVSGDRTTSRLRFLNEKERVEEIARMLGGSELTSRTLDHAEELLRSNRSQAFQNPI